MCVWCSLIILYVWGWNGGGEYLCECGGERGGGDEGGSDEAALIE